MEKQRLDVLLVERGLAESRARAQWLVRQGRVHCSGRPCTLPGKRFPVDAPLIVTEPLAYVSRGGPKLAHALDTFDLSVQGRLALDVGASTGGFTDCLLQRGASKVFAVDVGRGQLHPKLRQDERVVSLEQTDVRGLEALPKGARAAIATVDVSFISLREVLPAVLRLLDAGGEVVVLIKPQFEAGPRAVNRRGIVRRVEDRRRAVRQVLRFAHGIGLVVAGLCRAPSDDPRGNAEYLAHLRRDGPELPLEGAIAGLR